MGILKKLFGSQRSAGARNTLLAMKLFTSPALLMVPASDYETDDTRKKRFLVFLFGRMFLAIMECTKGLLGLSELKTPVLHSQRLFKSVNLCRRDSRQCQLWPDQNSYIGTAAFVV
jgi:hypothetical protein